jgi:DNA-directed RNA polymerase specialized sigma subunit
VADYERARSAEQKTRDLRQEFSELPFDRKIATLMQLETVAVTEAFDKITDASISLGKKIFDTVMPDASAKADQAGQAEKGKTV